MPGALGFAQGRRVGAGDQHDTGFGRVGQAGDGGRVQCFLFLQPGQRAKAGGAALVGIDVAAPRRRQCQQAQRVAGRCSVEDDVVECCGRRRFAEQFGEFVEGRDLDRARAGELFFHALDRRRRQDVTVGRNHPFAVGGGRRFRIDVQRSQTGSALDCGRRAGKRCFQHFIEVGGRIGTDDQHPFALFGQRQPGRAGQRGLADAALAGEEEVTRCVVQIDHGISSAAAGFRRAAGFFRCCFAAGQRQPELLRQLRA